MSMALEQIKTYLGSPDFHERLTAIAELKNYEAAIAIPLLMSKLHDPEFLVRSFVAMGLGKKQSVDALATLLELMQFDRDPNVRAEAANSLSFYGQVSTSHLVMAFHRDDHWLVRRSILAALIELQVPEALLEVCLCGLQGEDATVREATIDGLGMLAGTIKQDAALETILSLVSDEEVRIRFQVAKALRNFADAKAQAALNQLRQDSNHRVVAAALETLLPE